MKKLIIELSITILQVKMTSLELEKIKTYKEIRKLQKQLEELSE